MKKLTEGELDRYKYFLDRVEKLSNKYNISIKQTISILENIREFDGMYGIVEIGKFISHFLSQGEHNGSR